MNPREKRRLKNKSKNTLNSTPITYINYVLTISYDGSSFGGYAKQKFNNTIEENLQIVIDGFIGEHVKIVESSRTDAKVHACKQLVMFKSSMKINKDKFLKYCEENLNPNIEIENIEQKNQDFHVRYDVKSKTYIYKMHENKNVFLKKYSYYLNETKLNVSYINQICKLFEGTHDFKAFSNPKKDAKSTVRTINSFELRDLGSGRYKFIINADGFLYNMIRIIIGSIIYWNNNNTPITEVKQAIDSLEKTKAQTKISPVGLYLYDILF